MRDLFLKAGWGKSGQTADVSSDPPKGRSKQPEVSATSADDAAILTQKAPSSATPAREADGQRRSRTRPVRRQNAADALVMPASLWTADVPRLRRLAQQATSPEQQQQLTQALAASAARVQQRSLQLPSFTLDAALPVAARAEEISAAIRDHQVLVLAGETGSGKTTQLPKLAMQAGCGRRGRIALTQPRRLAARSVAARLAEELGSEVGKTVGVKIRFHQQVQDDSWIKVLTDGMLLAEIQQDRWLWEYDTIIVDEAHERSLNIDFLLGYLRQLKDKRPDLKIIVTSATIDLARFAEFFGGAPVISVSGRTYPVDVRYRPLQDLAVSDEEEVDLNLGIVRAVEELTTHDPHGDILVFLPGEADIRDAAELLRQQGLRHTEILPLFARQSFADQQRIFTTGGQRRIVLSTNVAETSLTVPGIRHVIDSGLARIKRYSPRNKVQRLPIEPISQASANQRKGRCGRVAPGVCIRLYAEEDFQGRPAFTEAEMQRSNLASVILQMQALRLGSLEDFPLIDPPPGRLVNDGYRLLEELQALDDQGRLSALGRVLTRLPMDPRLGRVLVAGQENGVLGELCVLAAVLSLQDPRETPADKQQAAREKHRLFEDARSDFMTLLNLWLAYDQQRRHLSHNKLKQWCQKHYLSARRLREWQELVGQLHQSAAELDWKQAGLLQPLEVLEEGSQRVSEAVAVAVHRALLTGLLGQIALRDERTRLYQGARGVSLSIHPSSVLARSRAKWIMAFEWVETSRTFARLVAEIDPAWLEPLAGHLLKRQVSEPYWSRKQGRVLAKESLTLYGLTVVADRPTDYGQADAPAARVLFVREGLVPGEVNARWPFLQHNRKLMQDALDWEDKTRRQDVLADDEDLAEFYLARLPEGVCRVRDLDSWLKQHPDQAQRLMMTREDVFRRQVDEGGDFPDRLQLPNRLRLPISYVFAPGDEADGMTLRVTLAQLPLLRQDRLERLVPGLLPQKIEAIIRALPKPLRVRLQPAAESARRASERLDKAGEGSFDQQLARVLGQMAGEVLSPTLWQSLVLPAHLRPRVCVVDAQGRVLACDRDLSLLQAQFAEQSRLALREVSGSRAQEDDQGEGQEAFDWQWDTLPWQQKLPGGGQAFMALVPGSGGGVLLSPLPSPNEAKQVHAQGVRRLLKLALAEGVKGMRKELLRQQGLCLPWARWQRPCADLVEQLLDKALMRLSPDACSVRSREAFEGLVAQVRVRLATEVRDLARQTEQLLRQAQAVLAEADRVMSPVRHEALVQLQTFVQALMPPQFVLDMPEQGWRDWPRYLKAVSYRLEKLCENLPLDERRQQEYAQVEDRLQRALVLAQTEPERYAQAQAMAVELWVAIFAQPHALKGVASLKRLEALLTP